MWGPQQASWFRRLDAEQDNLRAALRWALAHDEVTLALRLAGALWRFWIYHGDYAGWRRVIETALARATGTAVPAAVRAKALYAAGMARVPSVGLRGRGGAERGEPAPRTRRERSARPCATR